MDEGNQTEKIKIVKNKSRRRRGKKNGEKNGNAIDTQNINQFPGVWYGSYKDLEQFDMGGYGASIECENKIPNEGDFVVMITRKGQTHLGIVGKHIEDGNWYGNRWNYFTLHYSRPAPDIGRLLRQLVKQLD